MTEILMNVIDLIKILVYSMSFIYMLKLLRSKKTKKINFKFKSLSITAEYFEN
jgi:hypothetical protein